MSVLSPDSFYTTRRQPAKSCVGVDLSRPLRRLPPNLPWQPHVSWRERKESVQVSLMPRGEFAERLQALLKTDGYDLVVDLTTETATALNGRGKTYTLRRDAEAGDTLEDSPVEYLCRSCVEEWEESQPVAVTSPAAGSPGEEA